jgi:hypothetical protein
MKTQNKSNKMSTSVENSRARRLWLSAAKYSFALIVLALGAYSVLQKVPYSPKAHQTLVAVASFLFATNVLFVFKSIAVLLEYWSICAECERSRRDG